MTPRTFLSLTQKIQKMLTSEQTHLGCGRSLFLPEILVEEENPRGLMEIKPNVHISRDNPVALKSTQVSSGNDAALKHDTPASEMVPWGKASGSPPATTSCSFMGGGMLFWKAFEEKVGHEYGATGLSSLMEMD